MIQRNTAASLVMVALLVLTPLAMAGAVIAQAPELDDSNASNDDDTSTQSEITANDNRSDFNASANENETVQYIADSNDSKLEVYRENRSHIAHSNSSANLVSWNGTASPSTGNFNVTFSHADLADVERGIGENVTMKLRYTNNTTHDSPDTANDTWFLEADNSSTVQTIDDDDVAAEDIVTVDDENGSTILSFSVPFSGEQQTHVETNDRAVNGSQTDVVVVLGNATTSDHFSSTAEDASSGAKLSSLSPISGLERTVVKVEDGDGAQVVPVFHEEAPSGFSDDDTYAVYTADHGGETAVVVNLGDDFDDANDVSVETIGSAGLTTWAFEYATAGINNTLNLGVDGGVFVGFLVLVGAPRRRPPEGGPSVDADGSHAAAEV